jgi:alpha-tubulin suppressor-like RCC1 family protein
VFDIVNPIEVMSKVETVSTNREHTVVMMKDRRILGWGKGGHFSRKLTDNFSKPVDLTEEY